MAEAVSQGGTSGRHFGLSSPGSLFGFPPQESMLKYVELHWIALVCIVWTRGQARHQRAMAKRGRGWVETPDTSGQKKQQGKRTKKESSRKEKDQPRQPSESRNKVNTDSPENLVPVVRGAAAAAIEKASNRKGKGKSLGTKEKSKTLEVEESCSRSEEEEEEEGSGGRRASKTGNGKGKSRKKVQDEEGYEGPVEEEDSDDSSQGN